MARKADHQPQKVGGYERLVKRTSSSKGAVIGVIALIIVLIILAIIFF